MSTKQLALEERNACADDVARLRETCYCAEGGSEIITNASKTSAKDLVRSTPLNRSDVESLLGDLLFARGGSSVDISVDIEYGEAEFAKCIQRLLSNLGRNDPRRAIW